MSFLVPLALLLGAFALVPILAHALFRGPTRRLVFPAARFVPALAATSKKQNRIEDRALLALRLLLLFALALLASSPLVRCSRLGLDRPGGGSLAVALVIDDSASMDAFDAEHGRTRLERSVRAALDLLDAAKPGDVFSVVLAGQPARLLVSSTSDLPGVKTSLERVGPSDRATDLETALDIARQSLRELAQPSHQVLVFSDFATATPLSESQLAESSTPLGELALPFDNCALGSGRVRGESISVELACTTNSPPQGRSVSVRAVTREADAERPAELGPSLGEVAAVEGLLRIPLKDSGKQLPEHLVARLSPDTERDQLPRDDQTELLREEDAPVIGVYADTESASTATGTATVFELALRALDPELDVEPLAVLPDNLPGLARLSALIIDDAAGLNPETRAALDKWLEQGGVALLLGPRSQRAPLSAGFWPFLEGTPKLEATKSPGARPRAGQSSGAAWDTWTDLGATRRVQWEPDAKSRVLLPWADGAPLLVEQTWGQGMQWVLGLPASVEESDLALRPAFLALLERLVAESGLRRGSGATLVGQGWHLPAAARVTGPGGELALRTLKEGQFVAEPALEGRYLVQASGADGQAPTAVRYATRDPAESLQQPAAPPRTATGKSLAAASTPLPISREVALAALLLGLLELAFRAFRRKSAAPGGLDSPNRAASSIPAP